MAKIRKLTDPEIDEVSLVDKGANLRTFFFVKNAKENLPESAESPSNGTIDFNKANADIRIESNGTVEGTSVKINGDYINPVDFNFSMYNYEYEKDVYCSYTLEQEAEKGEFANATHYRLQKSINSPDTEDEQTIEDIKKSVSLIQGYLKEEKLDHLGENEIVDLAKSVDILADYKNLVPPEASEAIDYLITMAVRKSEKQDEQQIEEIKKEEKEMTDENKTEEVSETEQVESEAKVAAEVAPIEAKVEAAPVAEAVTVSKEELSNLVATITQNVTTNLSTIIDEKFKVFTDEDDEEIEVDLDQIADLVASKLTE